MPRGVSSFAKFILNLAQGLRQWFAAARMRVMNVCAQRLCTADMSD